MSDTWSIFEVVDQPDEAMITCAATKGMLYPISQNESNCISISIKLGLIKQITKTCYSIYLKPRARKQTFTRKA